MPVHTKFVVRGRIIGKRLKKRNLNTKKPNPLAGPAHKDHVIEPVILRHHRFLFYLFHQDRLVLF